MFSLSIFLLDGNSVVLLKFVYKFRETTMLLVYPSLYTYLVDVGQFFLCNLKLFSNRCGVTPWEDNIKMDLQEVGGGCGD